MLILVRNAALTIKGLAQLNSVDPYVRLNYIIYLLLFLARNVLPGFRKQCIQINWRLSLEGLACLKKVLYLLEPFREGHYCSWIQGLVTKRIHPSLWIS